jgi:hypothetical protein
MLHTPALRVPYVPSKKKHNFCTLLKYIKRILIHIDKEQKHRAVKRGIHRNTRPPR